jgi:chaperonin GroEL (HSP60 family)
MLKNVVEENNHKNLVVIAQDIEGTVLATLVQNKLKGQMNTLAVKVPKFQNKDTLQDISMYQAFDHFPEGIARLIPLEELGKAIRL